MKGVTEIAFLSFSRPALCSLPRAVVGLHLLLQRSTFSVQRSA